VNFFGYAMTTFDWAIIVLIVVFAALVAGAWGDE